MNASVYWQLIMAIHTDICHTVTACPVLHRSGWQALGQLSAISNLGLKRFLELLEYKKSSNTNKWCASKNHFFHLLGMHWIFGSQKYMPHHTAQQCPGVPCPSASSLHRVTLRSIILLSYRSCSLPCLPVLSTPLYVCYVWAGGWLISLVLVTKWQ